MKEIAIIGIGCLFPGAETPEQFWKNLLGNKDLTSLASDIELGRDPAVYFDSEPGTPDKICYKKHGYVKKFQFDARGYRLKEEELNSLDKLFHHSLYAAGEALKDGGYWRNDDLFRTCGLILGNLSFPSYYSRLMFSALYQQALEPYLQKLLNRADFSFSSGSSFSDISPYNALTAGFPATILARSLGLSGPCYSIDAACASALYCLKLASFCLEQGKSDSMLVGGLCSPDHLFVSHGFNALRATPPADGESIPFDSSSQGLSIGHGAAFLLIKSYSRALRDKDKIYAVIENIGLSNDGGAQHILSPDTHGQLLALERAYAGISTEVDHIECHATGTPLGDMVELNTLETFFKEKGGIPLLGCNKASVGHLLTASGMVSLIKIILAIKNSLIPAAIGVKKPLTTKSGLISGENMALENRSWKKVNGARRAGINAFGFGGTNAHLVLREHIPDQQTGPAATNISKDTEKPLAIVGIGVGFGDISGKDDFTETVYQGRQCFKPLSSHRWIGTEKLNIHWENKNFPPRSAYFDQAEIDCMKMKIPPNMLTLALANHFFMAKIAEQACRDAGGLKYIGEQDKVAVIVVWETDPSIHRSLSRCDISWQLEESLEKAGISLEREQKAKLETIVKDSLFPTPLLEGTTGGIGSLAAARISSIMGFRGPAFNVASQENSVFKALELARLLLDSGEAEAALVGSLDMAAGWETVFWRDFLRQFENRETSREVKLGEGGGAIIVKPYAKAQSDRNRIYSVINASDIVQKNDLAALKTDFKGRNVSETCRNALAKAGIKSEEVDYIELHGSGFPEEDKAEKNGLAKVYYSFKTKQGPTIGSVKANIGHTFASSGMASLIKASLCLYNHFLPSVPRGKENPDYLKVWDNTPFKVLGRSASWPQPEANRRRMAAVNCLGADGSYSHLIISEPDKDDLIIARKFESALKELEKRKSGKKAFIKTLLNGAEPIGDVLLKPEYMKQFQTQSSNGPFSGEKSAPAKVPFVVLSTAHGNRAKNDKSEKLPFIVLSTKGDNSELPEKPGLKTKKKAGAKSSVVWNREQIIEMTEGRLANVLGPEYEEIDQYPIRARVPSPPFMFVDRVTRMTARKDQLKPCVIEWEYDVHPDAWYITLGVVPMTIPFEASHTLILALSYIGCDKIFKGACKYRALDSQVDIYEEMPRPGETFKGEVKINSFIKSRKRLLIFYEFNGYSPKGTKLFSINANAGFFPESDLEKAQGLPSKYKFFELDVQSENFSPLLECAKTSFSDSDIQALQKGRFEECFGSSYVARKPLPLGPPKLMMFSRILSVETGGGLGWGVVVGEVDIEPRHWIFESHFKNDPVMPGTMLVSGCAQTLMFYAYYLGLHTKFDDFQPSIVKSSSSSARFRGEASRETDKVQYRLIVKDIQLDPEVYIVCDAEIIHGETTIGICENLSVRLVEAIPKGI